MAERAETPRSVREVWAALRNPGAKPDWSLTAVVLTGLGVGMAIAVGLGDVSRVLYTAFPALIAVAVGLAAGFRAGATVSALVAGLVTLATLASATPLTAALAFAVVIIWLTVPSRFAPAVTIAPLLQLSYFIIAAFGMAGTSVLDALLYSVAGAVAGMLVLAAIGVARSLPRRSRADGKPVEPTEEVHVTTETPPPTAIVRTLPPERLFGYALAAIISAGLLYWRLSADSQTAAWVLLTFILVFQPTHPATTLRSLYRVAGTIAGLAVVLAVSALLPDELAVAVGVAAVVPSVAYAKRDYVISVAAATVLVVTAYGAPTGDHLGWGFARLVDTVAGAAIAIALSAVVRHLERPALQTSE